LIRSSCSCLCRHRPKWITDAVASKAHCGLWAQRLVVRNRQSYKSRQLRARIECGHQEVAANKVEIDLAIAPAGDSIWT
jgi:hypothetical protein